MITKCPDAPKKQYYNDGGINYNFNTNFEDSEFYEIELESLIFGQNQKYLYDQYYYQQKKLEWENNNLIILNYRTQRNNINNNFNSQINNDNTNKKTINFKI